MAPETSRAVQSVLEFSPLMRSILPETSRSRPHDIRRPLPFRDRRIPSVNLGVDRFPGGLATLAEGRTGTRCDDDRDAAAAPVRRRMDQYVACPPPAADDCISEGREPSSTGEAWRACPSHGCGTASTREARPRARAQGPARGRQHREPGHDPPMVSRACGEEVCPSNRERATRAQAGGEPAPRPERRRAPR